MKQSEQISAKFVSSLCLGLMSSCLVPALIQAEEESSPQLKDRELNVVSAYFYRRRTDENIKEASWPSQEMKSNVMNFLVDYTSGYLDGKFKTNLAWIAALNFQPKYRCSEVAFCAKSPDRRADGEPNIWAYSDLDGIAISKASLQSRFNFNRASWNILAGYDQFNIGVLGVNWGYLFPGSYRGVLSTLDFGPWSLGYAWTDAYRTPWATEFGGFYGAAEEKIDYLHTAYIRYRANSGWYTELAAGQAINWQDRYFAKLGWDVTAASFQIFLNSQYYYYTITGLDFASQEDSYGQQYVVSLRIDMPLFLRLSAEYIATDVNSWFHVPEFIPRMTAGYGSSQGRLDYWWNAVSDFNKADEQAYSLQLSINPSFQYFNFNLAGTLIYAHNIAGWNSERMKEDNDGYEKGYNLDFGISISDGILSGLSVAVHYTSLRAGGSKILQSDPQAMFDRYGLFSTDDLKIMISYGVTVAD